MNNTEDKKLNPDAAPESNLKAEVSNPIQFKGSQSQFRGRSPLPGHRFCEICKHRRRQTIEGMFLDWYTPAQISARFGISEELITEHCLSFGIDKERSQDTRRYYRAVVRECGPELLKNPERLNQKVFTMIVQQLDRISGNEQKARKNDKDVKREQQYIEETLRKLQNELHLSREDAYKVLAAEMPEIDEWVS